MAHLWVRDAETAYWFSLSRPVGSDFIEVRAGDQLTHTNSGLSAILSPTEVLIRVGKALTRSLDGHDEYAIEFHPESEDLCLIRETLEVIFRGKLGLLTSD